MILSEDRVNQFSDEFINVILFGDNQRITYTFKEVFVTPFLNAASKTFHNMFLNILWCLPEINGNGKIIQQQIAFFWMFINDARCYVCPISYLLTMVRNIKRIQYPFHMQWIYVTISWCDWTGWCVLFTIVNSKVWKCSSYLPKTSMRLIWGNNQKVILIG